MKEARRPSLKGSPVPKRRNSADKRAPPKKPKQPGDACERAEPGSDDAKRTAAKAELTAPAASGAESAPLAPGEGAARAASPPPATGQQPEAAETEPEAPAAAVPTAKSGPFGNFRRRRLSVDQSAMDAGGAGSMKAQPQSADPLAAAAAATVDPLAAAVADPLAGAASAAGSPPASASSSFKASFRRRRLSVDQQAVALAESKTKAGTGGGAAFFRRRRLSITQQAIEQGSGGGGSGGGGGGGGGGGDGGPSSPEPSGTGQKEAGGLFRRRRLSVTQNTIEQGAAAASSGEASVGGGDGAEPPESEPGLLESVSANLGLEGVSQFFRRRRLSVVDTTMSAGAASGAKAANAKDASFRRRRLSLTQNALQQGGPPAARAQLQPTRAAEPLPVITLADDGCPIDEPAELADDGCPVASDDEGYLSDEGAARGHGVADALGAARDYSPTSHRGGGGDALGGAVDHSLDAGPVDEWSEYPMGVRSTSDPLAEATDYLRGSLLGEGPAAVAAAVAAAEFREKEATAEAAEANEAAAELTQGAAGTAASAEPPSSTLQQITSDPLSGMAVDWSKVDDSLLPPHAPPKLAMSALKAQGDASAAGGTKGATPRGGTPRKKGGGGAKKASKGRSTPRDSARDPPSWPAGGSAPPGAKGTKAPKGAGTPRGNGKGSSTPRGGKAGPTPRMSTPRGSARRPSPSAAAAAGGEKGGSGAKKPTAKKKEGGAAAKAREAPTSSPVGAPLASAAGGSAEPAAAAVPGSDVSAAGSPSTFVWNPAFGSRPDEAEPPSGGVFSYNTNTRAQAAAEGDGAHDTLFGRGGEAEGSSEILGGKLAAFGPGNASTEPLGRRGSFDGVLQPADKAHSADLGRRGSFEDGSKKPGPRRGSRDLTNTGNSGLGQVIAVRASAVRKNSLSLQTKGSQDDSDVMPRRVSSDFGDLGSLHIGPGLGRRNSGGGGSLSHRQHRKSKVAEEEEVGYKRFHAWVNPTADKSSAGGRKGGRNAVTAESEFELRSTVSKLKATDALSPEEAEWLLKVLRSHFLFNSMPVDQLLRIVRLMERREYTPGMYLVRQGEENATDFFVVGSGEYEVSVNKEGRAEPVVVAQLGPSATLGEMALLYNTTRTATVRASVDSHAFCLSRAAYQLTLIEGADGGEKAADEGGGGEAEAAASSAKTEALRQFGWLHEKLRPASRSLVLAAMTDEASLSPGDPLLRSGQVGGVLVLILEGEVQFTGDAQKASRDGGHWRASSIGSFCTDGTLQAGDALAIGRPGDEALLATLHASASDDSFKAQSAAAGGKALKLLGGSRHRCAAVALTEVRFVTISMTELAFHLADCSAIMSSRDGIRALLQNTPWCHDVSRQELDKLAFAFKPAVLSEGDRIIEQDQSASAMHLLVAGELKVTKLLPDGRETLIFKPGPGDVLGERSIASGAPSMANVTAVSPSVTLCLTREAYAASLPARMQPRIEKQRYASQISSQGFDTLTDLHVLAVVGQGAFARVALARHKGNGQVYALKKIERAKIGTGHVRKQIMNERFVMGDVDHPFIAKLHATFKTRPSLFMVLEPCLGGELFTHMQREDILPEEHSRFYAACVVSAFEHLHTRNVIYRDLKPENIMIASNGYAKVVDFGFAKRVHTRTFTLCGTPEYLAPEMVMVRGHAKGVDWWALGVLLYEMVMGAPPFIIDGKTKAARFDMPPNDLYKAILNPNFDFYFPSALSAEICDCVRSLLKWDHLNRLGCLTEGAEDVKRHPFFAAEDWEGLLAQTSAPPFVPRLSGETDTSNFEDPTPDASFCNEPDYDYAKNEWDRDF